MKIYFNLVWVLFLFSGCVIQPIAPADFPYELMLQAADLPDGFVRTGGAFPEVSGGFSHVVGYSSDPNSAGKGLSHQITIYADVQSAQDSFASWENAWIPNAWTVPAVTYIPVDREDQSVLKCKNVQVNDESVLSCTFIQQRNNLIILVLANMDDTALNYEQFLNILLRLDERLPSSGEAILLPTDK